LATGRTVHNWHLAGSHGETHPERRLDKLDAMAHVLVTTLITTITVIGILGVTALVGLTRGSAQK
jgi:hypothetical protein